MMFHGRLADINPLVIALLVWCAGSGPGQAAEATANQLTPEERQVGWRLLFDGVSTNGWRGYAKPAFPAKGWTIESGCLKHQDRGGGGDIITEAQYENFELTFEWRLSPKANTGLKYFITENGDSAIGHEYQILDDVGLGYDRPGNKHQTASFYDVLAPTAWKAPRPPGEFNQSRILVQGRHVEHWLNGLKTLEYELDSAAVRSAVAGSKFKGVTGFGSRKRGHLLLQDHGGEAWFRNLKLRELPTER